MTVRFDGGLAGELYRSSLCRYRAENGDEGKQCKKGAAERLHVFRLQ